MFRQVGYRVLNCYFLACLVLDGVKFTGQTPIWFYFIWKSVLTAAQIEENKLVSTRADIVHEDLWREKTWRYWVCWTFPVKSFLACYLWTVQDNIYNYKYTTGHKNNTHVLICRGNHSPACSSTMWLDLHIFILHNKWPLVQKLISKS